MQLLLSQLARQYLRRRLPLQLRRRPHTWLLLIPWRGKSMELTQKLPLLSHLMFGFVSVDGVSVGNTHTGDIHLGELLHKRLGHISWGNSKLIRQAPA